MNSILDKLAAAAAQASAPGAGNPSVPAQGGGMDPAAGGDPSMDPAMAMPDPIEQDNMRLTNILQNLKLRQEVVQAQADLEQLTEAMNVQKSRPKKDVDAPIQQRSIIDDITSSNSLTELLKNVPKVSTDRASLISGKKNQEKDKARRRKEAPKDKPNGFQNAVADAGMPEGK